MDLKLRREAPVFKRCCFCIPLRRGLIGWGYAKLLLNILTICYIIFIMLLVFFFLPIKYISIYIAVVVSIMIDVAFTGLLIIACHKKNFKLLRISYIYSIVWLTLYMMFGAYGLTSGAIRMVSMWNYYKSHKFLIIDLVATSAFVFASMFLQVYVILLTRSEAIKLHNQSLEMQFVNNAAEAEARCVPAEQRKTEPYTDEKYSAPYTENGHDSSEHGVY
ncbi:uncharacterized protein [Choristoneura fumiferana]|uniref:uncharacterized protein n=1 Tax=Choristoneura fumiferana TaxID=7141 RepID=UPI003D157067